MTCCNPKLRDMNHLACYLCLDPSVCWRKRMDSILSGAEDNSPSPTPSHGDADIDMNGEGDISVSTTIGLVKKNHNV